MQEYCGLDKITGIKLLYGGLVENSRPLERIYIFKENTRKLRILFDFR